MRNHSLIFLFLLSTGCVLLLPSCLKLGTPYSGIPPGIWRGVLSLTTDSTGFDEHSGGELPFNFEVIYDRPDSFHLVLHNGEERIVLNDIRFGTDRRTARDTLWIAFPVFDSYIRAQFQEDAIEGWWYAPNRGAEYRIKFKAQHSKDYRFFENPEPPAMNVSGKWRCHYEIETDKPYTTIGDFRQEGNNVTGTFMTPTGDDRYLEGVVSGNRMYLSAFDGSHAYLYEAKILPDSSMSGIFRSGIHYKMYWEGKKDETIQLSDIIDPLHATVMKTDIPLSISFPDPDGNTITLDQPPFIGRPKIIQILGTWCPNCRDETNFLLEYLSAHKDPGFEMLGICFERHTDTTKAMQAIRTYKTKMNLPYPLVYGGSNNKDKASEALPMLSKVLAFPTLLFVNDKNRVVAIHTGFAGPATEDYEPFVNEFDVLVQQMTEHHD